MASEIHKEIEIKNVFTFLGKLSLANLQSR